MSGLPGPFGGYSDALDTAHFCPSCGEQCGCPDAEVSAGPEEEMLVAGCTHPCADRCRICGTHGYKPDANHQLAF
jgi:hypothetical protein